MKELAQKYLVEILDDLNNFEDEILRESPSPIQLKQYAESKLFPSWGQYQEFLCQYKDCIVRLTTDETAKPLWKWMGSERIIALVLRQIEMVLEDWYRTPTQTLAEFNKDKDEIIELSRILAGKLAKHYGNLAIPTNIAALVPEEYREQAILTVHPEFITRAEKKKRSKASYIGVGLPPIHVILSSMSELIKNSGGPTHKPKKIHSKSALRQLLLKRVVILLHGNEVSHSTTNLASLLYLILNDPSITDATIRGDLNGSDWWSFYAAQDS